jgi:xanthine dehydrogenase accessory factor
MKRDLLDKVLAARAAKRSVALVTDLETGDQALVMDGEVAGVLALTTADIEAAGRAIRADRSALDETGTRFVQVFNPPLRLIVVGAVHIAQALAPLASLSGYEVTVVDPRQAWATDGRFPGIALVTDWPDEALRSLAPDHRTAIVALTHDPKLDDPALTVALESEVFYIGALGSRRTHAGRLERLGAHGFDEAQLARIHGPIGLAIGAKTPAEIAISTLAQMTQVLHAAPAPASESPGA